MKDDMCFMCFLCVMCSCFMCSVVMLGNLRLKMVCLQRKLLPPKFEKMVLPLPLHPYPSLFPPPVQPSSHHHHCCACHGLFHVCLSTLPFLPPLSIRHYSVTFSRHFVTNGVISEVPSYVCPLFSSFFSTTMLFFFCFIPFIIDILLLPSSPLPQDRRAWPVSSRPSCREFQTDHDTIEHKKHYWIVITLNFARLS